MKKITFAFLLAVFCFDNLCANPKNDFIGTVTYTISVDAAALPAEVVEMMKGAEMVTFIKADKRRIDLNLPMQSTSSIIDMKAMTLVTLMNFMDQKYLIKMNRDEIKKDEENEPSPKIKYTEETKEIAGYKCNKAEVTSTGNDGREATVTVYYTNEIPGCDIKNPIKGLKGFPLEYSINQMGIMMSFIATKIVKTDVDDSKFEIPKEGYTETTLEGLQNEISKLDGNK